ncbi:MAG: glycosyltransferase [Ignavibacteriales bacterium]|nr:MAG: glycosyltransferase [Ignavibacteriales bacterium]
MKTSIKVIIISSRADYGGGPEHIFKLLNYLKEDMNFFVACPKDLPYWERYCSLIGADNLIEIPHRQFNLKHFFRLLKFIVENKIAIIHSHGKGAGIYSRIISALTGTPVVHTFHGIHYYKYGAIKKNIQLFIEKVLAFFTRRFIVVSEGEMKTAINLKIAKKEKLSLILNGVEIGNEIVEYSKVKTANPVISTITRFDHAKNPELLIPILKALNENDKTFLIKTIGSGESESSIKAAAEEMGLTSKFIFGGASNNPKEYLLNSFCYISTSRAEGLPLGVLEAMSVGLPVVATNVVGNNDIIENGVNGFLYDIDKPESASKIISSLYEDEVLWKKISEAGRRTIEIKYNIARMINQTKDVYLEIFSRGKISK